MSATRSSEPRWRSGGAPLADLVNEPALVGEIGRLEELRQSVVEQRIDAQLELGEHDEAIRVLEGLIAAHPLRERLRGQLILALYRAGRQAEALETYRETRRVLVEELGIEPSPELRSWSRRSFARIPRSRRRACPRRSAPTGPPPPTSRWRWPRSPLLIGAASSGGAGGSGGGNPRDSSERHSARQRCAQFCVQCPRRPRGRRRASNPLSRRARIREGILASPEPAFAAPAAPGPASTSASRQGSRDLVEPGDNSQVLAREASSARRIPRRTRRLLHRRHHHRRRHLRRP